VRLIVIVYSLTHSPIRNAAGEDVYTETGKRPGKNGTGLVAGHAYSLIAAKETSKGDKLVKLR